MKVLKANNQVPSYIFQEGPKLQSEMFPVKDIIVCTPKPSTKSNITQIGTNGPGPKGLLGPGPLSQWA